MMSDVQYFNGNYYQTMPVNMATLSPLTRLGGWGRTSGVDGYSKLISPPNTSSNNSASNVSNGMFSDPFGTAMSGTKAGTLQPYVNRMTQNASNALYGGLLDYQPQSLIAGDAGGTPVNSTAPQWNLPSSIGGVGQGLNFTGFGNRSWMGGQ